jgi:uncharacterized membrane protein (DUF4010 family)
VAALLMARVRLHRLVISNITANELHDVLILAGAALVVLPIMPDRFMGPYHAINPYALWRIVVLMLAISAAGHVAMRVLGVRYGLPLTGLVSGFVSSAMSVSAMGHHARSQPSLLPGAVAGAMLSTMVTSVQMAILLGAISPATLSVMALPLLCAGITAGLYALGSMLRHGSADTIEQVADDSTFGLLTAVSLAAIIGAVLMASAAIYNLVGLQGLVFTSTLTGLADAHAPGIAVATLVAGGKIEPMAAVLPILAAMSSNTLTKVILAWSAGGRRFLWQTAPGLLLSLCAAWLALPSRYG